LPRISFFIGKGGVGKTTVAASYALWRASKRPHKPLLLLSTDPAHSLSDVLRVQLTDEPRKLYARLFGREIDASAELQRFMSSNREHILKVIEKGSFFTAEEVAPLLDATLPGMAEIAGLLAVDEALESNSYDEIIVDTAPLGHTLRLFDMPGHFAQLLEFLRTASSRDELLAATFAQRRLAPDPFLEKWSAMVGRLRSALVSKDSQLLMVTTPEAFAVAETLRASDWLRDENDDDIPVGTIILNRSIAARNGCDSCDRRMKALRSARKQLSEVYPDTRILRGEDPGAPLLGVDQLSAFGRHIFEEKPLRVTLKVPTELSDPKFERAEWPTEDREMAFTVGKGGVGKTTISAALALRTRAIEQRVVNICSTDPAPSLDDVFRAEVGEDLEPVFNDPGLRAAEINAVDEYQKWASQMQRRVDEGLTNEGERGLHLDLTYDRELLNALLDVVPPGVDEIFAILRISEIVDRGECLIIDMAPTGHAIDLLKTPERLLSWTRMLLKTLAANRTLPLARDAGVEVATIQHRVRELAAMMKNHECSSVDVVMLPELLPDRETRRLLRTLKEIGVGVRRVFINRVMINDPGDCLRCRRSRRWQMYTLQKITSLTRHDVYVVPEVPGGISGRAALDRFTRDIWRLA
jgi:arsenite/tail-anchored protein-transporting ATPase